MITIYGPAGTSAGRCYWTLEEIGLSYEVAPFSFKDGDHRKPDFLALNPNGKVPVLRDGDHVLWESMAINQYLAETYKPELLGKDTMDKVHISKWSFWALADYQTPIINVFIQKVFVPEDRRDQAVIEKGIKKVGPMNKLLNEHLNGRNHLIGDDFTLADLNVASVAKINRAIGIDLGEYPHLETWLNKVLERPAAQRVAKLERS